MPSSAALIGVPSGTETLMPSFCCPLGFGPNAVMTRPFTGQRKLGIAAVTSALAFGGSGSCAAGVTIAALGAAAGAAGFEATFGADVGAWVSGAGTDGLAAACGATPGMTIRSPTFTIVCGSMLLALAISPSGL